MTGVRRFHLFEIGDLPGCPAIIRDAFTDYLRYAQDTFRPYLAIVTLLHRALERTGATRIVDLCSGGAGPWPHLLPALSDAGSHIRVSMTDKFINRAALTHACAQLPGRGDFVPEPVDAMAVPESLHGFRTLFSAFHHFPPNAARDILADAVRRGQGIGIFEITQRSRRGILRASAIFPLVLLWAPRLRPFRWSRFLLTWLVPLMPVIALFDSLVSCLRTYTPDELRALTTQADPEGIYVWEIGEVPAEKSTVPITYLLGYPLSAAGRRPHLRHADICTLLPHTGNMCLLETVQDWNDEEITCLVNSHRDPDNPLRRRGILPAVCGVEYAAQAMGVHGRLVARSKSKPSAGYLVSLRDLSLKVDRLDQIEGALTVRARRLAHSGDSVMCEFSVGAGDQVLVSGRATLLLEVR